MDPGREGASIIVNAPNDKLPFLLALLAISDINKLH